MDEKIKKNLNKLYKKKCLEKQVINTHEESLARVKKEVEKLKEEIDEKEQENTKKFEGLPKGILFQFGKHQIYLTN
ncbi:hypothetical protein U8527_06695 [Kordia algicida OT-1]|uniref:Uncharacterized protein n=1 Tax=Kordia algicida OT-1 TaxID=391587 RepID=A9CU92_9FLAO|nr:hypothetical protein [Kordia algicida]EDP94138.1 hypothetical protein KAOT1_00120 [Kordia algicida OT-1]